MIQLNKNKKIHQFLVLKNLNNINIESVIEATETAKKLIRTASENQNHLDNLIFKDKVMVCEKQSNINLIQNNALFCKKFFSNQNNQSIIRNS
jgi:hypothetical protein